MTAKKAGKITEKGVLDGEIKQLMTPEAIKELKDLSPTMQQFLLRWQDHRDIILGDQLKEELKDFLLDVYEKDNISLCKKVTDVVCTQVAETISPMWTKLEEISKGIISIKSDILIIKADLTDIKKRLGQVEEKVESEEERITRLEKTQRWWNIAFRIAIAVAISTIITLLFIHYLARPLW
jgi:hypothetical protein